MAIVQSDGWWDEGHAVALLLTKWVQPSAAGGAAAHGLMQGVIGIVHDGCRPCTRQQMPSHHVTERYIALLKKVTKRLTNMKRKCTHKVQSKNNHKRCGRVNMYN